MKLDTFFARHPIFRIEELSEFLEGRGSNNPSTRKALLAHHLRSGRILRIRRGIFASVPLGASPTTFSVDPLLVAGRITADAILAYHTALEAHGKAHTTYQQFTYLTIRNSKRPFRFQGTTYRGVSYPRALSRVGSERLYADVQERAGLDIHVTNLERSLVDVLDRPRLAGSWEEIWRSLEKIEYVDLDLIIDYTTILSNATTASKVGYYLQEHRGTLMVNESHLKELRRLRPRSPHYMDRSNVQDAHLVAEWNLIVPRDVHERVWEEPA